MKLRIAWIGRTKESAIQSLTAEYLKRISHYVSLESHELSGEEALLKLGEKSVPRPFVVLLDSQGKQLSSEALAGFIDNHRNRGTQSLLFAVGPANGFGKKLRESADFSLSLGPMTLAHELARVVLLEQLYRAYTILTGHPYHTGH